MINIMAEIPEINTSDIISKYYYKTIDIVFAVILLFITLTMIVGVARLFIRLGELFQKEGITGNYLYIFSDVLTLFILIELSRSLVEYFSSQRLPMTPIIDAGIVFIIRHIMIDLFNHKLETNSIYALSVLLLALGAIRVSTLIHFRRRNANERSETHDTPAKS